MAKDGKGKIALGSLSAAFATTARAADSACSRRVRVAALRTHGRFRRALITDAGKEQNLRRFAAFRALFARSGCRSKQDQLAHGPNPDDASFGAGRAFLRAGPITRTKG